MLFKDFLNSLDIYKTAENMTAGEISYAIASALNSAMDTVTYLSDMDNTLYTLRIINFNIDVNTQVIDIWLHKGSKSRSVSMLSVKTKKSGKSRKDSADKAQMTKVVPLFPVSADLEIDAYINEVLKQYEKALQSTQANPIESIHSFNVWLSTQGCSFKSIADMEQIIDAMQRKVLQYEVLDKEKARDVMDELSAFGLTVRQNTP